MIDFKVTPPEPVSHAAEIAELRALRRSVEAVARTAAREERQTKRYRNRTGRLMGLTGAASFGGAYDFTVDLHMGAFYGAFVQARGFSDFEHYADTAEQAIDAMIESL